ncbi:membrane protein [Arthrobacter phage Snek]|uniref:Membrane protein n=1 Tax=Arthrobacter phage Tweety19 TaxID=2768133 RepID=A0A7G9W261_9CAUD|nr:membrane protein [Arthrobacter phage Tweety19]QNO12724.1 membrane protein [Arthrobacter phage Tweety19]
MLTILVCLFLMAVYTVSAFGAALIVAYIIDTVLSWKERIRRAS